MKTIIKSILVSLIFLANVGFAQATSTNNNGNAQNVYTENKTAILATSAQPTFIVKLKSNPTTGFSWFLRDYDSKLIQPVSHSYVSGTKNMPGAPGFDVWTLKATPQAFIVPHQTVIRFVYVRPWESDSQTTSTTQLVFVVSTQGK